MDTITTLEAAKSALDEMAKQVGSASRLTRSERDEILSRIYSINLNENDRELLMQHIASHRKLEGANRAYVMKSTNGYMLPVRYVFPSVDDRSTVSRYSGALDQLAREGIPPNSYKEGVKKLGGLMQLYWLSRDRVTRRQMRQTLTLNKPIEVIDGHAITLTLIPDKRMIFEVASYRLEALQEDAA